MDDKINPYNITGTIWNQAKEHLYYLNANRRLRVVIERGDYPIDAYSEWLFTAEHADFYKIDMDEARNLIGTIDFEMSIYQEQCMIAALKESIISSKCLGIKPVIKYSLVKTKRRLTFDILEQAEHTRYRGEDDGPYITFRASNGYEVISRSRMDIQTERLWLLGASDDERSGSMVFSSDEKRDACYEKFVEALNEWASYNSGIALQVD